MLLIPPSRAMVVTRFKQRLKRTYADGHRLFARAVFGYSSRQLADAIRSIGIGTGDTVLLHSGFERFSGFAGTPTDVIECLLEVVGADGNLLMMSIPYIGSSRAYANSDPVFDVLRSPSTVGVISEVFRRRPDVLRSHSPLHPILARGPLAAWLLADHDQCLRSCGKGSPFDRLLSVGGKFLFYDAPYRALTFVHYVEDRFRDRLPVPLYEPEPVRVRVKDPSGRESIVRHFVFSEQARARRDVSAIERALLAEGAIRQARIGNTRLLSVDARTVVDCAGRLIEQGPSFYRAAP